MTLSAPAKVNLRLKVIGRRPDGYHLLDMVMVKLDLADEMTIEIGGEGIRIECDDSRFPSDSSNTIWKMVERIQKETGRLFGVTVRVQKKTPIAAGLGGGSSDAAAVLLALNKSLHLEWGEKKLIDLGSKVGADVPFFLVPGSQRVSGIGEILEPVRLPPFYLILVNPGFPVSTQDVYRWYDETLSSLPPLTPQKLDARFPPLENDLERVVLPRYPVLVEIKERLRQAGALGTMMSGSGPTLFGLFDTAESRDRGYEKLVENKNPDWWICKTQNLGGVDSNHD